MKTILIAIIATCTVQLYAGTAPKKSEQRKQLCNMELVEKCSLPYGSWSWTPSALLAAINKEPFVSKSLIEIDTMQLVSDSVITIQFRDGYQKYYYEFSLKGDLQYIAYSAKYVTASDASAAFRKVALRAYLASDSTGDASEDSKKYIMQCGASEIRIEVSLASDGERVFVSYTKH